MSEHEQVVVGVSVRMYDEEQRLLGRAYGRAAQTRNSMDADKARLQRYFDAALLESTLSAVTKLAEADLRRDPAQPVGGSSGSQTSTVASTSTAGPSRLGNAAGPVVPDSSDDPSPDPPVMNWASESGPPVVPKEVDAQTGDALWRVAFGGGFGWARTTRSQPYGALAGSLLFRVHDAAMMGIDNSVGLSMNTEPDDLRGNLLLGVGGGSMIPVGKVMSLIPYGSLQVGFTTLEDIGVVSGSSLFLDPFFTVGGRVSFGLDVGRQLGMGIEPYVMVLSVPERGIAQFVLGTNLLLVVAGWDPGSASN